MNGTPLVEGLDRLVLVWLAVPRKSPSHKSLASMLKPFVRDSGEAPETAGRRALARLKERGDIAADTVWLLSPAGLEKALAALGIPELPRRASWKWVYSLLVARGQGAPLTPASLRRLSTPEGLAAAVLEKQHRIQSPERAELSPAQVGQALAWRALGVESTAPFTLKAVLIHLVERAGISSPRPKDSKQALAMLAALAMRANRGHAPLRVALVRQWMATSEPGPVDGGKEPAAEAAPVSIERFAQQVLEAARTATTGRWGEHKVFVSHVFDELTRRDPGLAGELGDFKRRLVQANQAALLSLSHADLVEVMDPVDVRRSEISSLGATFHFVRVD